MSKLHSVSLMLSENLLYWYWLFVLFCFSCKSLECHSVSQKSQIICLFLHSFTEIIILSIKGDLISGFKQKSQK